MDNQSVDRAYRIGQKRNVVVYRLISCSTLEENIYRKQVCGETLFDALLFFGEENRVYSKFIPTTTFFEEMHMSLQVFKGGLMKVATEKKVAFRYFSQKVRMWAMKSTCGSLEEKHPEHAVRGFGETVVPLLVMS